MRLAISRGKPAALAAIGACIIGGSAARAQLVTNDLYRTAEYTQSSPSSVTLDGYFLSSRVFMATPTDFDGGTLSYPAGSANYSVVTDSSGAYLNYQTAYYPSSSSLNAAYPAGAYTTMATNSSTNAQQTTSIDYSADAYPQTVPQLMPESYTMLQNLNSSAEATINFNSDVPDPSATNAYVFFYIFDSSNNDIYDQTSLPSSTTSVTIPAGTLQPGKDYTYRLVFSDRIDSTGPEEVFDELGSDYGNDGTIFTMPVPEPVSLAVIAGVGGASALARRR